MRGIINAVCNMNQLCLMHVCRYRTVQHKGERLDHDSPWVASFHTVSAGWPRWSPGLSVDSWTEDLQRQNRVQHLPIRYIVGKPTTQKLMLCFRSNQVKLPVYWDEISEWESYHPTFRSKDTSVPRLHEQVRVFDSNCKEKCLVKSKVGCGKTAAVPWGDLLMRPNR